MKLRRQDWLNSNGPCVVCGSWDNLEVDHINPDSKESHNVWSWSEERRTAELSKCQVLCKTHHQEKTALENSVRMGGIEHGSDKMYSKYKCRCEECKMGKNGRKKANRNRRLALGLTRD